MLTCALPCAGGLMVLNTPQSRSTSLPWSYTCWNVFVILIFHYVVLVPVQPEVVQSQEPVASEKPGENGLWPNASTCDEVHVSLERGR